VNERLYRSGVRAQFVSGLIMPLMQLINNTGYVLVCVVGGAMAARRSLEVGDIQAFLQYLRHFTMPIVQTATIANVIQSTVAAAERSSPCWTSPRRAPEAALPPEAAVPPAAPAAGGEVRFEGVSFRYKPETPLIEDLSIDVEPASSWPSSPHGSRKTTR
jgi:ATP-binding cassette subfamily B protein